MRSYSSRPGRLGTLLLTGAAVALGTALSATGCDPTVTFGSLDGEAPSTSAGNGPQSFAGCTDTLVTGMPDNGTGGIFYHQGFVYWFSRNYPVTLDVLRVPITGGTPQVVRDDVFEALSTISGDRIYWGEKGDRIVSANLDGTDVVTLVEQGGFESPTGIAVSEDELFWSTLTGGIYRRLIAGGPITTLRAPNPDGWASDLRLGPTDLYFVDQHELAVLESEYQISKMSRGGGPEVVLRTGTSYVNTMQLTDDALYFTELGGLPGNGPDADVLTGVVGRIGLSDAEVEILAQDQPQPQGLAIDETGVYWGGGSHFWPTDTSLGEKYFWSYVKRITPDGETAPPVSEQTTTFGVVGCDHAICWFDSPSLSIKRYKECVP